MARALENSETVPTYLDFFGMTRPPFSRLTGPTPVFHAEQYSLLMSNLADATEQSDCLLVVCGADGSGKTTLLNRHIAGLGEDTCYAAFDETCTDGTQFYLSFLRQLGFNDIAGKLRELRRITREFVIHRALAGETVLVIVDNAHLISPMVLEQLRWISETKVEERRVLSIVLAGNHDLPRIMESPAMRLLKFRNRVDFNIRVYTEEETEDYIRHRLRLAGGVNAVKFSNDAHPLVYRFTGGIPNSINMLCNAVFTEAFAQKTRVVTEELIRAVAEQHQLVPHVVPLQSKGRRKTDPDVNVTSPEQHTEERITAREAPPSAATESAAPRTAIPDIDVEALLEKITQLSEQLGEFKSAAKQARSDIAARDRNIKELREQLAARTEETEQLFATVGNNADEIGRLDQSLAESAKTLQESEDASNKLAEDLKKEEIAAKRATTEAAKARAKIEKQDRVKSELQATVKQLKADLKAANKRVNKVDRLETGIATLNDEIEEKSDQLRSRDKMLADFEKSLQESRDESESLRSSLEALKNSDNSTIEKDIIELREQLAAQTKEGEQLASTSSDNATEIERLTKALSDSETILVVREQALSESEKALSENEKALAESKKALSEREQALSESEKVLSEREKALSESEKALSESDRALFESERALSESESALSESQKVLSDNEKSLQEFENTSTSIAADLKKEKNAAKRAQTDIARANAKIEKLEHARAELQKSVSDLTADLRQARKQSAKIGDLETSTVALSDEIKEKVSLLKSRDDMLADLEKALEESRSECQTLQSSIDALHKLEESLSERDARIADLEADLASYSNLDTSIQPQLPGETEPHSITPETDAATTQFGSGIATIEVFKGGTMEQVMNMTEFPSRIMIGRGDDSELRLDSKFVSRHHALVFCTDDGVYIEDLNSFNGTIVNSRKITRCDLNPDDTIIVGDYELRPRQA